QARTRLGDFPITIAVLRPAEWQEYRHLPKSEKPTVEQLRYLLLRSVALTDHRVRRAAGALDPVPGASRSAALRGVRLVRLDERDSAAPPGVNFRVRLDERQGVVIEPLQGGD